jgi:hypothetical protein
MGLSGHITESQMGIPSAEGRQAQDDLPWRDEQVYIGTSVEESTRERTEKVSSLMRI